MKDGTGGDPFADDATDTDNLTADSGDTATAEPAETPATETASLPYIYARETVKEGRDQVPFFLREHVQDLEDEFIDDLEERLGETVYKADAREAALVTVYNNYLDEVAELLREWGYSV